jgi:hypothetical protein
MQSIKNFIAVTLGVMVALLMGTFLTHESVRAANVKQLRAFYLTTTDHNGASAPSACATGFHMASMWEIVDPSNLRYDTTLGFTQSDSGSGPPTLAADLGQTHPAAGWIRTGTANDQITNIAGATNCEAWSTTVGVGTVAYLPLEWSASSTVIAPWAAYTASCSTVRAVWCVED